MTEISAGKRALIKWEFTRDDGELGTVDGTPEVKASGNGTVSDVLYDGDTGLWSAIVARGDGSQSEVTVTADVDLDTAEDHKKYQDFKLATLVWLAKEVTQVTHISVSDVD